MAYLFGMNPFSTPVGQRIERATDSNLPSEDWALNIEICDIINETEEGPKDAIKALKKILVSNKNFKSVLLTLTVLETSVKNCGHRFHVLVAKKDFLDDLTRILSPKNNPPQVVQEKILTLIQGWADAFRGSPDLSGAVQVYNSLREQGIEFPAQDFDALSPIFTPERTQPERPPVASTTSRPPTSQGQPAVPAVHPQPVQHSTQPVAAARSPIHPTPEQLAKLRSELDIVQGNVTVMSEMLTEMTPGQEEPGDMDLLQELNRTCRSMQQRLLELLQAVANEEVIGELLRINDDLNNVFIRYDRYERFCQAAAQQNASNTAPTEPPQPAAATTPVLPANPPASQAAAATTPVLPANPPASQAVSLVSPIDNVSAVPAPVAPSSGIRSTGTGALISFEEERGLPGQTLPTESNTASLGQQLQDLGISSTTDGHLVQSVDQDEEFDMFAQSRKSTFEESRKMGSSYTDNRTPFDRSLPSAITIQKSDKPKPSAMDSVESWLAVEDVAGETKGSEDNTPPEILSSSEFDKFLAERAQAGGQRSGSAKSSSSRPRQRQMQMDNPQEDEMFGL